MTVGFLGLGTMGFAMASNLLKGSELVLGWNRSDEPADRFALAGGKKAESAKAALALPISFSMLANDQACDLVLAMENLTPGTIHVGMASISPDKADELEQRFAAVGASYVSAPVLGRPAVAAAGALNIIAGGDAAAIDEARPYLETMSTKIWAVGQSPRTANLIKIAVNYNILHAIQAIAESVALAESAGVEADDFVELLTSTLFGSVVYKGYGEQIASGDHSNVLFSMPLGKKDLSLAIDAAAESGLVLPTANTLMSLMDQALLNPELADKDWAAVAEVTLKQTKK